MKSKLTPEERFFTKVNKTNTCWLWTAGKDYDLYGAFKVNGIQYRSHRYSYELHFGEIPKGMCVCHACDNPSCVNPEHLFLGTNVENTADRNNKGRTAKRIGHWKAKLTEEDVVFIRSSPLGHSELGRQFDVCPQTIFKIRNNLLWKENLTSTKT
jgi:hypothetical protein